MYKMFGVVWFFLSFSIYSMETAEPSLKIVDDTSRVPSVSDTWESRETLPASKIVKKSLKEIVDAAVELLFPDRLSEEVKKDTNTIISLLTGERDELLARAQILHKDIGTLFEEGNKLLREEDKCQAEQEALETKLKLPSLRKAQIEDFFRKDISQGPFIMGNHQNGVLLLRKEFKGEIDRLLREELTAIEMSRSAIEGISIKIAAHNDQIEQNREELTQKFREKRSNREKLSTLRRGCLFLIAQLKVYTLNQKITKEEKKAYDEGQEIMQKLEEELAFASLILKMSMRDSTRNLLRSFPESL